MLRASFEEELRELVNQLSKQEKQQLLIYARSLVKRPKVQTGAQFLARTAHISIPSDELDQMEQAIEAAFEVVRDLPDVSFDE